MTKTPEQHYRNLAQAIYDTYTLLDHAKNQLRRKNVNPFLMVEIFQDIEASLGNVYGEAQLLHAAGQELIAIASQHRTQRDEALAQAQDTERLTHLLEEMLKHSDQLLNRLLAASTLPPADS